MIEKPYNILKDELKYLKTFDFNKDKDADSFWNREYNYDEIVIEYIRSNINTLKMKDGYIDILKLYDDLLVNNVVTIRLSSIPPYHIFRIIWRYFSKYLPPEDVYKKMYNNSVFAYRFHNWSDKKRKKRRSYVRIKKLIFDILEEDYNVESSVIANRVSIHIPLVKRILLDDLRGLI